mmetsp:Transcript_22255/g.77999  ORF Transcript_22255/g.77999 Transcript_22255/m.77999 type:complete len:232 (-) Transcript_22255:615-1310(-)
MVCTMRMTPLFSMSASAVCGSSVTSLRTTRSTDAISPASFGCVDSTCTMKPSPVSPANSRDAGKSGDIKSSSARKQSSRMIGFLIRPGVMCRIVRASDGGSGVPWPVRKPLSLSKSAMRLLRSAMCFSTILCRMRAAVVRMRTSSFASMNFCRASCSACSALKSASSFLAASIFALSSAVSFLFSVSFSARLAATSASSTFTFCRSAASRARLSSMNWSKVVSRSLSPAPS